MRITVASEGLEVSPRFGHCSNFTCYKIQCGIIVECQNMPNPHLSPARLASMLRDVDVSVLIAGSIEHDAADALREAGIDVVTGKTGTARKAVEAYLARTLIGCDEEDLGVVEA